MAEIRTALAELGAAFDQLRKDGVPAEKLDGQLAGLHARLDAAAKPVAEGKPQQKQAADLAALKADVLKAAAPAKADAARQQTAQGAGGDTAITDLRDAAAALIAKADPDNPKTPDLSPMLGKLDAEIKAMAGLADPAKQGAARQQADTDAKSLIGLAAAAAAKKDRAAAYQKVQAAYKEALSHKYGITIGEHSDTTVQHTNLDALYDTLEKVPVGHVAHERMKDLSYTQATNQGHGTGRYNGVGIEVGDYGDETWPYTDPVTKKPYIDATTQQPERPNGFRITVLHELGHSVDKRWGIMKLKDPLYGDWSEVDGDELVNTLATAFADTGGKNKLTAEFVKQAAKGAVFHGEVGAVPAGADEAAWALLTTALDKWATMRKAGKPWEAEAPKLGKVYSYVWGVNYKTWFRYATAARGSLETTPYQWSAPSEWFAELYAIAWYHNKPIPGVDAKVAAFLPGGDAAGNPAAQP